ncbi:hypothetical protein PspLS_09116 [Pyricularia sp. CBS 133598]|nr:hypothetical protein PspLS_09116 [Pyricularia sp. CBS 133598]
MQYSTVLTVLFAGAMASSMAADSPVPGYRIETMQWSIEVAPGHFEVLNGTIQEVMAQAHEVNPDFEAAPEPEVAEERSISSPSSARLSKRAHQVCNQFPYANTQRIREGIATLNSLPAGSRPTLPRGPGTCGRVSCSGNSAIYWCNDNFQTWGPGGWEYIARSAQKVFDTCAGHAASFSGQGFEDEKWKTIITGDQC